MKAFKLILVMMIITFLTIYSIDMSEAQTFHAGGVAYCDGCHTMHNSYGGAKMTSNNQPIGTTNSYLLQGGDQSSTCLICHGKPNSPTGGYVVATNPKPAAGSPVNQYTPGGDFAWLQISYNWTATDGSSGSSSSERHGHNIIAADFGYTSSDSRFATGAPGGTYPVAGFGCHSCHDPHGKYRVVDASGTVVVPSIGGGAVLPIKGSGSYGDVPTATEAVGVYRLLAGKNYQPKSLSGSFLFENDPPVAMAPATYNQLEDTAGHVVRVAYGNGMSLWCANCHGGSTGAFHSSAYPGNLRHPTDMKFTSVEVANYNAYVKSGDLTGGNGATAYNSLVPFEEGAATRAALIANGNADSTGTKTAGADSNSKVTCISCHRAHASAWDSATRWNVRATFVTMGGAYPGTNASGAGAYGENAQGRTQGETQGGYYGRSASVFATYQRSLCNKCHAKD